MIVSFYDTKVRVPKNRPFVVEANPNANDTYRVFQVWEELAEDHGDFMIGDPKFPKYDQNPGSFAIRKQFPLGWLPKEQAMRVCELLNDNEERKRA